jgi:proton-dependent oligopeptide transporter, POT family
MSFQMRGVMTNSSSYRTAPERTERIPSGIPFIVGNEGAERFSYYGMRAILVVFMTQFLMGSGGELDVMSEGEAKGYYHLFVSAVYFFPIVGAVIADAFLGKYRTVIVFSLLYCLGHLALALDDTRIGLSIGLTLIAIGSGGIKPCVSANVGDQFGALNQHLLSRVFGWFYFAVNLGSFVSTLLIPIFLKWFGPHVAFGVPGLLMFVATWIFWLGRRNYVHVPPGGMAFVRETFSVEGFQSVGKLVGIYAFVAVFWALYDQTASAWVLQARSMNLHWMGVDWLPSQIQAINPVLILIFIPIFSYGIYPAVNRVYRLTPLRKVSIGLFVTVVSFLIPAWIETLISAGETPGIFWQVLAYMVLTAAEVMVSITCLEFSYTQAPKNMKSLVMGIYYMSVSLGNAFTALVNFFIQNEDGSSKLAGASYYLFFSGLMFVTAILFIVVAMKYQEKTILQDGSV